MRWTRGDRSNIEDLRGRSGAATRIGSLGLGGLLLLFALSYFTGIEFLSLMSGGGAPVPGSDTSAGVGTDAGTDRDAPFATTPEEEELVDLVDAVMRDAQGTWRQVLGPDYRETRVRLFRDAVRSACGFAQSATGPFYCPADGRVYLDLGFFDELHRRLGAPVDFAQAYVLAHELGHHVQNLTGTERRVRAAQQSPSEAHALSVRMELQADCYAGVWAHAASQAGRAACGQVALEPDDAREGLNAAAAIGDDRLQRMGGGAVAPDRFTHGSSAQRVEGFQRGLQTGDPRSCDSFSS